MVVSNDEWISLVRSRYAMVSKAWPGNSINLQMMVVSIRTASLIQTSKAADAGHPESNPECAPQTIEQVAQPERIVALFFGGV